MPRGIEVITLRRPDDWHVHLRDGGMLTTVVRYTARQFARAIVMPNLVPPVTSVAAARAYRGRILAALPRGSDFVPLMTCYLTDTTEPEQVAGGLREGVFTAVKLYPARATTNSAFGVTDYDRIAPVLECMAGLGMPLLIHGEETDPEVDVFDREAVFIERILSRLVEDFPKLRIVFEHITTEDAVRFVQRSLRVAATVTPQHLIINRNAIFSGGIRPHLYCLPIAKREKHRRALRRAATSGNEKFFLGTDSAPHAVAAKEAACGCAGIFTAPCALEIYAEVFEEEAALDRLEAFVSLNGPKFYKLPPNEARISLRRESWMVPERIGDGDNVVVPFHAGETLRWRLQV